MISTRAIGARFRSAALAAALTILGCFIAPGGALAAGPAAPALAPFDLVKLQQMTLTSAAGSPYRIVIAPPAGPPPAKGYPVIYVVDGNAWTGMVSEIIRTNLEFGLQSRVEPAVVVGIGYPIDDAFDMKRRDLDLTSPLPPGYSDPNAGTDPTGGDVALMDFIDTVVKPAIEARFKIDRTRQTLMGHSLGGLFTLRTLFNRPQSFQTYVAFSPSIWWGHRQLMTEAQQFVAKPGRPDKLRVFLSAGDLEQYMTPIYVAHARDVLHRAFEAQGKTDAEADKLLGELQDSKRSAMVENAREMAALLNAAHISARFEEFPGEDHFSVLPSALGRAVPFALGDEFPDRAQPVESGR
jgi:predicted alpha/beta superfamily hydrolase